LKVNANYTFTQVEEPLSRLIQNTKEIFQTIKQHRALSLLLITSLLIKGKMLSLMAERLPPQPFF
jgi:hypothetical protein